MTKKCINVNFIHYNIINEFLLYLTTEKRASKYTVKSYKIDLTYFLKFINEELYI